MAATLRERLCFLTALVPLVAVMAGCDMASMHNLAGRASDEWTHKYPLSAGGEVEIVNTNGKIEIEGTDADTVEITAERVAKAATDSAASDLLPHITVKEDIKPDHVKVETERMSGMLIGASYEVRYLVRAPKNAVIRITTSNGEVTASGTTGQLIARTTNGSVTAKGVSGAVTARTTNGEVTVDLSAFTDKVSIQTTNGGVKLTVPDDTKADLSATCSNGGIDVSGLKLETTESSRRRVEGKVNGGGTLIDLRTTNGGIRLRARSSPA